MQYQADECLVHVARGLAGVLTPMGAVAMGMGGMEAVEGRRRVGCRRRLFLLLRSRALLQLLLDHFRDAGHTLLLRHGLDKLADGAQLLALARGREEGEGGGHAVPSREQPAQMHVAHECGADTRELAVVLLGVAAAQLDGDGELEEGVAQELKALEDDALVPHAALEQQVAPPRKLAERRTADGRTAATAHCVQPGGHLDRPRRVRLLVVLYPRIVHQRHRLAQKGGCGLRVRHARRRRVHKRLEEG
mmetsp:Transcript_40994/g.128794  ORF Transcript_40994/g.128794 Transcript_40994/m.128794 type:complete len:248 (-) Transcript_40994:50-793(-)